MTDQPTRSPKRGSSALWTLPPLLVALAIAVPLLIVLSVLPAPAGEAWRHLRETLLLEYMGRSLQLMLLTGSFALIIAVPCAWFTGACRFPGSATLGWLLVLPLAAPAYVVAYAYTDLLDVSGPIQAALRQALELSPQALVLPPIRSLPGAALLLSLVLYPYVYVLARNAFATRSGLHFEAARVLGVGPLLAFWRVALPAARPAIAGGLALVLMETLADFGVVEYFSVPTLSTGIYRTWIGLGEKAAALKLAALMLLFVLLLVGLEAAGRRGRADRSDHSRAASLELRGWHRWVAFAWCAVPVAFGFALPVMLLAFYAIGAGDAVLGRGFARYLWNSISMAGGAALLATALALLLAYSMRLEGHRANRALIRISTLGYALPGVLLAVALLGPVSALDRWLITWLPGAQGGRALVSGSVAVLLYAYVCRFLTVAYQSVDAGLTAISSELDAAARTLGASPGGVLRRVHLPLLARPLAAGMLLVFVDVMRELPATLLLRPFNFETLATRVYRLASDERLAEASTAALCIVLIGIVPVLLINRASRGRA
ncbi:MAG: iron ABC transporter permease [Pseudomonadota bacterium]